MAFQLPKVRKEAFGNPAELSISLESLRKVRDIGSLFEGASVLAKQTYHKPVADSFRIIKESYEENLDPNKIHNIVENQNFEGINTQSPEYLRYLAIASIKEQLARQAIREVVRGENNLNLTKTEKTVLLANCDLADEFDGFNVDFQDDIMSNQFYKRLSSLDPDEVKKLLREKGVLDDKKQYLYVNLIEKEDDGSIEMVPYSVAYKDSVDAIAQIMEQTVEELEQIKDEPEAQAFSNYYQSYQAALTSSNVSQHEDLWKDLDIKWLDIRGRMQPIHMMESYSDNTGLRVEPDFALQFLDDRQKNITELTNHTKEKMIASLVDNYVNFNTLMESVNSMKASIVGAYTSLVGGARLNNRPAGQNIPNRPEVRMKGVKIFIDMETMKQRWIDSRRLLVSLFGETYVNENFNAEEIIPMQAGVFVGGHEVAHNAFIAEDTRIRMGVDIYKDIEEHKSDMAITTSTLNILSPEERVTYLKGLFAMGLRILKKVKDDPSRKPYAYSDILIINVMNQAGILNFQGGEWVPDFDQPKVDVFFIILKEIMKSEIVPIYDEKSSDKGQKYIKERFIETDILKKIVETISR